MDKAEMILRKIVLSYRANYPSFGEHSKIIVKIIEEAETYISVLDACEFQTENGAKCNEVAIGEVHGMKCCKYHFPIRSNYQ